MKLNEVIAKYGNQEVDESKIKEVLGVKESKIWKPKLHEVYYYIGETGIGTTNKGIDNTLKYDLGNFYKTFEEADFAIDKQIFLTKVERYLREYGDEEVDWGNNEQPKFYLKLDVDCKSIEIDIEYVSTVQGAFYTTNFEAFEYLKKHHEADIKKYMFGVKGEQW